MELWIRSQDKTTLIRSYEIYIVENSQGIYCIRSKRTSHILGTYKNFDRALEVLDEIQKLLKPQIILRKGKIIGCVDDTIFREPDGYDIEKLSTYVYEMPQE